MSHREVARGQRSVVFERLYFLKITHRDNFRNKNSRSRDSYKRYRRCTYFGERGIKILAFVNNGFIITAGALLLPVAGGKFFLHLTPVTFGKQGNVLNLPTADVHAYHKATGRNQHQQGEGKGGYGTEVFHLRVSKITEFSRIWFCIVLVGIYIISELIPSLQTSCSDLGGYTERE